MAELLTAKQARTKAKMSLSLKVKALGAMDNRSRGVDLDNSWSAVKDAMTAVSEKHENYLFLLIPENGEECLRLNRQQLTSGWKR